MMMFERGKQVLPNVLYPILLVIPLCVWVWLWKGAGWDVSIAIQVVYWGYLPIIIALEHLLPFERAWIPNDGQLKNDLILTASSVAVNALATVVCLWAIAWAIKTFQPLVSLNVWPTHWPLLVQLVPGILLWDLGNHLAHRWSHEVPLLWRFHAVHHSAPRLSVVNTGRFHPFDVIKSVVIGAPIPVLLGVPAEVSLWYAAFNSFNAILVHANIRLQCGIFNSFLNTPNLHRWHHSPHRKETDTNYGEATVVWDRLFGTYMHPSGRPHRNVGLGTAVPVSAKLLEALVQPLTPRGHRASGAHLIASLEAGEAGPLSEIKDVTCGPVNVARL
jgi:sterol desaturase/sphingolipid hydroxylase (fatty acid hydroxylase superfamily)